MRRFIDADKDRQVTINPRRVDYVRPVEPRDGEPCTLVHFSGTHVVVRASMNEVERAFGWATEGSGT